MKYTPLSEAGIEIVVIDKREGDEAYETAVERLGR